MRVLWLVTAYPSVPRPNTGVFHRNQVQALIEHGLEIDVVVPTPFVSRRTGVTRLWSHKMGSELQSVGETVLRPRYLAVPRQNVLGIAHWLMQGALRALDYGTYDVVHAHFAYPMGLVARRVRTRWSTPIVLTLHGSDVNVFPKIGPRHLRQFKTAVTGASEVLAVSRALANRTQDLTGRRPRVLPIGINLDRFRIRTPKKELRRRLGLPVNRFLVLYVGNFLVAKGIEELLKVLSMYKSSDVIGVFAGSGPLEGRIRQSRNTHLLGALGNEQVADLMAASDVLVLPSYREGLPTVVVEAGASGLPVVATSVGGIPELIGRDAGFLVKPRRIKDLFEAIERVRLQYDGALARAKRLEKVVQEAYDVHKNAGRLASVYRSLVN